MNGNILNGKLENKEYRWEFLAKQIEMYPNRNEQLHNTDKEYDEINSKDT